MKDEQQIDSYRHNLIRGFWIRLGCKVDFDAGTCTTKDLDTGEVSRIPIFRIKRIYNRHTGKDIYTPCTDK